MKLQRYLYLILGIVLLCSSCRKDEIDITFEDEFIPEIENITFQFLVTDESGNGLEGAQIAIQDNIYTTDDNGVVKTSPHVVPPLGLISVVSALGYETLTKVVSGAENSLVVEKVILFKVATKIISTGSTGGLDGEGFITLPQNLEYEDGTFYNGDVKVKSKYLDPDKDDFLNSAPGNLLAKNSSEEFQQLASFGMYMIELYDLNDVVLSIPEGSTSTIKFPIAEKHVNIVGDEIPLWYFNETNGLWIEDGIAKIEGDVMIAEVNHFTWWNCDLPYDFAVACFVFLDANGEIMKGVEIEFSVNGVSFGNAITDELGNILVKYPIGVELDLVFYINCEQVLAQSVGPYDDNTRKKIVNTNLDILKILGSALNCTSISISDGYGYYSINNKITIISFANDGSFEYFSPGINHSLILIDSEGNKFKEIVIDVESQTENLELGSIVVCEEEVVTKISGFVLIDVDEDNIGETPLEQGKIKVNNLTNGIITEVFTDENGYYEIDALPGNLYKLSSSQEGQGYRLISVGDHTPDGDNGDDAVLSGSRFIHALALIEEHDSDNNFWLLLEGVGTIKGSAKLDSDGDGLADVPMEWATLNVDVRPGEIFTTLIESDGTFAYNTYAANYLLFLDFGFFLYDFIAGWDTSPDPDGEISDSGSDQFIRVILYDGEIDEGNEFIVAHADKKTFLCRVMEDTNMDGIGDVFVSNLDIKMANRLTGGSAMYNTTDEYGIARFFEVSSSVTEFSVSIEDSTFEVIDIIDLSPDNNPLIIDNDFSKMEIDMNIGEWDAGNIFVVRKI